MASKSLSRNDLGTTKRRGRPRLDLDPSKVEILARVGCTAAEIAAVLGCSSDTLERNYAAILKGGRDHLAASIKRKQVQVAMTDGHKAQGTMLVWLGKQYLGQRDRFEHTGKDGEKLEAAPQVHVYMPANGR